MKLIRGTSVALVWAMLQIVPPLAGPAEDHAAAFKSYQDGDVVGAMPGLRKAAAAGMPRPRYCWRKSSTARSSTRKRSPCIARRRSRAMPTACSAWAY